MIYKNGLAPDPRSEEEKKRDYKHEDVAGAVIVVWKEKPQSEWKKYTPREQDGSLSCCGQASAKAVEILNHTVMSAHPPYRSRVNFPQGGMYLQNVGEVWKNIGSTTEILDHSEWQNETEMNRAISVLTPTKIGGYVMVAPKNIEEIAQAIELHGHCIQIVHCAKSEWKAIPEYNGDSFDFGHCICAVDYFLHNGQKVILIEDSTGHFNSFDSDGQRLITEDFLIKRFEGAMYFTIDSPVVHHTFVKTLRYGMTDNEVKFLQIVLQKDGEFPQTTATTNYFGPVTRTAVKAFQTKHNLGVDGVVGPLTRNELNKL